MYGRKQLKEGRICFPSQCCPSWQGSHDSTSLRQLVTLQHVRKQRKVNVDAHFAFLFFPLIAQVFKGGPFTLITLEIAQTLPETTFYRNPYPVKITVKINHYKYG